MEYVALIIYDIRDNKLRLEVSRFLKRVGLTRIQKSAFAGSVRPSDKANIEAGLRKIIRGWSNYNIQIYIISSSVYSQRVVLSEGYSLEEEEEEFLI
ncbi:MAG: CRISPR-associated endonuclease Cas2 [Candidatus Nezhaarchaeales archaeon]